MCIRDRSQTYDSNKETSRDFTDIPAQVEYVIIGKHKHMMAVCCSVVGITSYNVILNGVILSTLT